MNAQVFAILLLLGLCVLAVLVWLTWYIGIWLVAALVVLTLTRWFEKHRRVVSPKGWLTTAVTGAREVITCMTVGLGGLTLVQLVVNLSVWVFSDFTAFDATVSRWLWQGEETLAEIREVLVGVLHPRVTLSLIAMTLFASVVRPDWKVVQRTFGARKHLGRALQVITVLLSASFFTSEYAAQHERRLVLARTAKLAELRAVLNRGVERWAAAEWMRTELESLRPTELYLPSTLIRAVAATSRRAQVLEREGARLVELWKAWEPPRDTQNASTAKPDAPVPEPAPAPEATPIEELGFRANAIDETFPPPASFWRVAANAVRGPMDPRPSPSAVRRAEEVALHAQLWAEQAEAAALEALKLAFGQVIPSELDPPLKPFVKVVTDAAAKTFVHKVLARSEGTLGARVQAFIGGVRRSGTASNGDTPDLVTALAHPRPAVVTALPSSMEVAPPSSALDIEERIHDLERQVLADELRRAKVSSRITAPGGNKPPGAVPPLDPIPRPRRSAPHPPEPPIRIPRF